MPTVTIKNGNRKLTLTKRELDILNKACVILLDISEYYLGDLDAELTEKIDIARDVLDHVQFLSNSKPATK